jgi:hypothetical protein
MDSMPFASVALQAFYHDRPKGDALMQRQDQDAVREKILKRPGTSTAPKSDGTYIVEFRTAAGEVLAISIPRTG